VPTHIRLNLQRALELDPHLARLRLEDILAHVIDPLNFLPARVLAEATLLLLLLPTTRLGAPARLLLLLARRELAQQLAPARHEGAAQLQRFALRVRSRHERRQLLRLPARSSSTRRRLRRLDRDERIVQARRDPAQPRAHEIRRRRLNRVLPAAGPCQRQRQRQRRRAGCGRGRSVVPRRERIVHKRDATRGVVYLDSELAPPRAAHDVRLDLAVVVHVHRLPSLGGRRAQRRDQLVQARDLDRGVHLRELVQEAREQRALQEGEVGRVRRVRCERLQQRGDDGAERERVKRDFEDVVERFDGLGG
jgi:hypothetical protein